MTTRSTLQALLWGYLGTTSDDPQYSTTLINPLLQSAADAILHDMQEANPDYLSTSVTLTADSASSHLYTFATQSSPITDFGRWLEVRWTDENGSPLTDCRREELRDAGADFFCITGPDESPVLRTSADSDPGTPLYFVYSQMPAAMAQDSDSPTGIPSRYHDLVPLEAARLAYGLGGEQQMPAELIAAWRDRRAQLLARVGRRGIQPSRTRLANLDDF